MGSKAPESPGFEPQSRHSDWSKRKLTRVSMRQVVEDNAVEDALMIQPSDFRIAESVPKVVSEDWDNHLKSLVKQYKEVVSAFDNEADAHAKEMQDKNNQIQSLQEEFYQAVGHVECIQEEVHLLEQECGDFDTSTPTLDTLHSSSPLADELMRGWHPRDFDGFEDELNRVKKLLEERNEESMKLERDLLTLESQLKSLEELEKEQENTYVALRDKQRALAVAKLNFCGGKT